MGLRPVSARRQAPDVRAGGRMSGGSRGAGCPGLWPDVRAERGRLRLPSVMRGRISGEGAGCPGLRVEPDVRGMGPDVRACGASFCEGAPDVRAWGPDVRGL